MSLCSLLRPDVSCALIRVLRPPACPGASPPFPLSILYTLRCTYLRSPEEVRVMTLQQDPTRPGPMADEILPPLRASPRLKIYSLCVPTFVPKLSFPNFSPHFFLNFLPNLCPNFFPNFFLNFIPNFCPNFFPNFLSSYFEQRFTFFKKSGKKSGRESGKELGAASAIIVLLGVDSASALAGASF